MASDSFTPTQQAMLDVLADGLPHTRKELHACLPDELGALVNIQPHLCKLRKRLQQDGEDVICCLVNRSICYRYVRLIVPRVMGKP